jgi:hypothetical protein
VQAVIEFHDTPECAVAAAALRAIVSLADMLRRMRGMEYG